MWATLGTNFIGGDGNHMLQEGNCSLNGTGKTRQKRLQWYLDLEVNHTNRAKEQIVRCFEVGA